MILPSAALAAKLPHISAERIYGETVWRNITILGRFSQRNHGGESGKGWVNSLPPFVGHLAHADLAMFPLIYDYTRVFHTEGS